MRRVRLLLALTVGVVSLLAVMASAPALGQVVESLFPAGPTSDGYYVPYNGRGRLAVAILAGLEGKRPITLGARIRVQGADLAPQEKHYESDVELFRVGRQSTKGWDQWYLEGFAWVVSCNGEGEVAFNGEAVGPSPGPFVIEVGIVLPGEADEEMTLGAESIAATDEKHIVCGKLAPLPQPQ